MEVSFAIYHNLDTYERTNKTSYTGFLCSTKKSIKQLKGARECTFSQYLLRKNLYGSLFVIVKSTEVGRIMMRFQVQYLINEESISIGLFIESKLQGEGYVSTSYMVSQSFLFVNLK